jgi:hypothetical protein
MQSNPLICHVDQNVNPPEAKDLDRHLKSSVNRLLLLLLWVWVWVWVWVYVASFLTYHCKTLDEIERRLKKLKNFWSKTGFVTLASVFEQIFCFAPYENMIVLSGKL